MEEKCLCEPNEILIFSCAGSSNVGQIANQATIMVLYGIAIKMAWGAIF